MEWSNEKTILLIEDYHNSPELWNNKINEYKDIRVKNDKLKQLADKYNCTVSEIKKKIKNLRSAFHRERKKLLSKKSGSSPNKRGKWFAYELLSFLIDVDIPKPTLSTAGSEEEDFEVSFFNIKIFIMLLLVYLFIYACDIFEYYIQKLRVKVLPRHTSFI